MGRGRALRSIYLIAAARAILADIHPATVRAVCYQLFNRKLITSMAKGDTNRVSKQLTHARDEGIVPWEWLVDETREAERVNAWENPAAYIETVKRAYRRDRWALQPERIEVWSEKGTIRGTLAPVLHRYGVTFRVMHGYGSTTAVHDVAVEQSADTRRPFTALYVGDWDPSGLHMSAIDLPRRLLKYGGEVDLVRVALTDDHIRALGPGPSFPAADKSGDSRCRWFVQQYGRRCWELDALSPVTLRAAVEHAIVAHIDAPLWNQADQAERAERDSLASILNAWPGISGQASKYVDGENVPNAGRE
jgi:hypothetical protein